jgi:hypothetical protein
MARKLKPETALQLAVLAMTKQAAAKTLGVSVSTVDRLIAVGELEPIQILARTQVSPASVARLIERGRGKRGRLGPRLGRLRAAAVKSEEEGLAKQTTD